MMIDEMKYQSLRDFVGLFSDFAAAFLKICSNICCISYFLQLKYTMDNILLTLL